MNTIYIDTETTGLSEHDEIVQLAIISDNGDVLFNSYLKPKNKTSWKDAERVNGISPEMVANAPYYDDVVEQVCEIVKGKSVVIYNAGFDSQFLIQPLSYSRGVECCMELFSEHYGEWSDYFGNYKWQKLITAASFVQYQWNGKAHDALADCFACRAVWHYLTIPAEMERVQHIKKEQQLAKDAERFLENLYFRQEKELRQKSETFFNSLFTETVKSEFYARLNDVHFAFVGMGFRDWESYNEMLAEVNGVVYTKKKDIPSTLVSHNQLGYHYQKRNQLKPKAVFSSEKLMYYLYDKSEFEQVKKEYPIFEKSKIPENCYHETDLKKKIGLTLTQIYELERVGKAVTRFGHYYSLYKYIPK